MTAFSPAILPAFDFMLDVPAYALGLVAIVIFLRALDRQSVWLAIASAWSPRSQPRRNTPGYWRTALVACSLVRAGLPWRGSGGVAVALFAGWELFTRAKYGESHFLFALNAGQTSWRPIDQADAIFCYSAAWAASGHGRVDGALRMPWVASAGFARSSPGVRGHREWGGPG